MTNKPSEVATFELSTLQSSIDGWDDRLMRLIRTAFDPSRRMTTAAKVTYATERATELAENLDAVKREIAQACSSAQRTQEPRLVVVSKLKPPSDILALHEKTSHLHFGENYVQELVDKASILPASIRWRFIGSLQSNKCKVLAAIPNLAAVETLDSVKKADLFERALSGESDDRKLAVYLQVNTSGEESKSGLPILADRNADGELAHLALHVLDHCPHLELQGLMTIGAYDNSNAPPGSPENADFRSLRECRDALKEKLGDRLPSLELSMGMSSDFADAIRSGSDNIRVGSKLMGSRPSKAEAKEAREQQKVSA